MDKNTIIGFILIFWVLFGFAYLNHNRPIQEQLEKNPPMSANSVKKEFSNPISEIQSSDIYGNFAASTKGTETFVTIQNALMEIKLSTKGGRIYSVRLKKYTNYKNEPLYLFEGDESAFNIIFISSNNKVLNSEDFYFEIVSNSELETILRLNAGKNRYIDFVYTLHPDDYMVDWKLVSHNIQTELSHSMHTLNIQWMQKIRQQEKGRKFEERYARLTYKFLTDDIEQLRETKDDVRNVPNKLKWIGYKDQFFSSVFIVHSNFESAKLDSKYLTYGAYIKEYSTSTSIPYNIANIEPIKFNFYFGPNDYSLLKSYDKTKLKEQNLELEKLVPLGWSLFRAINKCLIIPIFNWLTNGENVNLGLAILILTLIIKIALFPLTYKSFISSAKMRVLKPQVENINIKYSGQEKALIRQQKTMELYRQVGVNPMTGCFPILLQMPFLIALFMFFPSAIGLRHQSFLWANDLSTYDTLIQWSTDIPFIPRFLGNHISLFCLLMSLATILNTRYNTMYQQNIGQEQFPGMKLTMYFMPVVMFFFLNSYPAGLNYYYLISTLITIMQTIIFRGLVNELNLLAKLEANKKKSKLVKKKFGFMDRLEEFQRKQQELLKKKRKR
ncbi:MAG: membrane protein insertase YidC [Candidatus Azobacteroides pseudotrichonymphae]|jgi:YidC/Oxa1 family membrane protein insertase|uniref:Membrane protein insertase YidC n=1 Tax=Azobacteroides pseudotrichonymphae genomovar. CFP2 TaxID=511995 RepID=YIDC_AZOPC|nr:membrane protein insertase YidC [Candidatus Azobacteroides pseudotrichonymphae]B6YQF9.1 RecName: Full=Membrane protein insertase YidC; AltName: Full=Foldase YidC; AltName: Full=Membrane integrase YidC; AltName: Full=Membrane protein YidC [Candidatus Azobacteroides pseudotrichonymphae genomovar. CFP2]MDR0530347.1 membrane protein insertase YidC [Bacteroidales bacterium OttesenSCG-928-I14]BAG83431.1 preprotein translocase YidC subunit [Candidatus Azobacteroides pseudotrichonymphae genomovar. CF